MLTVAPNDALARTCSERPARLDWKDELGRGQTISAAPVTEERAHDDYCRRLLAPAVRTSACGRTLLPSRFGFENSGRLSLAKGRGPGCSCVGAGPRTRGFERLELYAWHGGKSLPARISRDPAQSTQLRWN